jgi:hypothetical protein
VWPPHPVSKTTVNSAASIEVDALVARTPANIPSLPFMGADGTIGAFQS